MKADFFHCHPVSTIFLAFRFSAHSVRCITRYICLLWLDFRKDADVVPQENNNAHTKGVGAAKILLAISVRKVRFRFSWNRLIRQIAHYFFVITNTPFQSSGGGLSTKSIDRWM